MIKKLREILINSKNILILAHNDIDADAISSLLLTKTLIETHFENKNIEIYTKEKTWPKFEEFELPNLDCIQNLNEDEHINFEKYDTIFLVDISEFGRRTADIPTNIDDVLSKTIVIDHHLTIPEPKLALEINNNLSSASMQIYLAFKEMLKTDFKLTKDIALLTQIGIMGDTGRFLFTNTTPETYTLMAELTNVYKVNAEKLEYTQGKISAQGLLVLSHIIQNTRYKNDFLYTYIDPDFISKNNIDEKDMSVGYGKFKFSIMKFIENVNWGFIITEEEKGLWAISFRSKDTDVVKYAKKFDGGGHLYAAGGRIEVQTSDEAIEKILSKVLE